MLSRRTEGNIILPSADVFVRACFGCLGFPMVLGAAARPHHHRPAAGDGRDPPGLPAGPGDQDALHAHPGPAPGGLRGRQVGCPRAVTRVCATGQVEQRNHRSEKVIKQQMTLAWFGNSGQHVACTSIKLRMAPQSPRSNVLTSFFQFRLWLSANGHAFFFDLFFLKYF